jgi:ribonuclease VapC
VLDLLEDAVLSTVNLAEVISKQVEIGAFSAPAAERLFASLKRIEPLSAVQGRICGALRGPTRKAGLSLGDRCCLALAIELGAEVYTAERVWAEVDVGCRVHLIR